MKESSPGLSIKRSQREEEQQGSKAVCVVQVQTQQIEEDFVLNEYDLNYYW